MLENPKVDLLYKQESYTRILYIANKCRYGANAESQQFYDQLITFLLKDDSFLN